MAFVMFHDGFLPIRAIEKVFELSWNMLYRSGNQFLIICRIELSLSIQRRALRIIYLKLKVMTSPGPLGGQNLRH